MKTTYLVCYPYAFKAEFVRSKEGYSDVLDYLSERSSVLLFIMVTF